MASDEIKKELDKLEVQQKIWGDAFSEGKVTITPEMEEAAKQLKSFMNGITDERIEKYLEVKVGKKVKVINGMMGKGWAKRFILAALDMVVAGTTINLNNNTK